MAMERPETMCPQTNFLGPLVPKVDRPTDTMSLHWYIPVVLLYLPVNSLVEGICFLLSLVWYDVFQK